MIKLNKKTFLNNHKILRKTALAHFNAGNFNYAIETIQLMARLAYSINLFYDDNETEQLIYDLSNAIIDNDTSKDKFTKDKWVFYDSFGWDKRGLSQQYIRALIKWDVEFLYILGNPSERNFQILKELENYNKVTVLKVPSELSFSEKSVYIFRAVIEYKPSKAFLHFSPWDIEAIVAWNKLEKVERFLINITDHAFWYGVNTFDVCIEFRNYGYQISNLYRNLSKQKLRIVKYYPIIDKTVDFEGVPIPENEPFILTGGSFYKVFGEEDAFFKMLKKICEKLPNVSILFAGSGNKYVFNKLLDKYGLTSRVYLLGDRSDLIVLINKSLLWIDTFPVCGGLTSMLSLSQGNPTIGFTDKEKAYNNISELLYNDYNFEFTYTDYNLFIEKIVAIANNDKKLMDIFDKVKEDIKNYNFEDVLFQAINNKNVQSYNLDKIDGNFYGSYSLNLEREYLNSYFLTLQDKSYLFDTFFKNKVRFINLINHKIKKINGFYKRIKAKIGVTII